MFYQNLLTSCWKCFAGHRADKCQHTDQPLWARRNKGRPGLNGTARMEQYPDFPRGLSDPAVQAFVQRMANDFAFKREYYHETASSTPSPPGAQKAKPHVQSSNESGQKGEDMYRGSLAPEHVILWRQLCGLPDPKAPPGPVIFQAGQVEFDANSPASDVAVTPMDEIFPTSAFEGGSSFLDQQLFAIDYIPSLEPLTICPLDLQMDIHATIVEQADEDALFIPSNSLAPDDVSELGHRHLPIAWGFKFEEPVNECPAHEELYLIPSLEDIYEELFGEE